MTGTSPRASVSDTKVWQLAVLPSAEAYCGATPTECVPFLGIAVSSITSTASLPPTSLSARTSSSVSTGAASHARGGQRRWPCDELGQPAEVLSGRCQGDLELSPERPAQS